MDRKPKINLAGYLSFAIALIMNLLFIFNQFGIQTVPKGGAVLIFFPMMLVVVISGINGIYNAVKYEMGGKVFSILGIVGIIVIPIVSFLDLIEDLRSISG